jgi:hypothetical protein
LEAKRMKVSTNEPTIADLNETANDEDILVVPRIGDKLEKKIRLSNDYSVKIIGRACRWWLTYLRPTLVCSQISPPLPKISDLLL